jgi:FkbM family methyltransferase
MSAIKTSLKRVVPEAHWHFLSWYREHFGFLAALWAYNYLLFHHGLSRAPNLINGRSIFLRPGTADLDVYHQIFTREAYHLDLGEPLHILDAGAHIGISAVYFASRYPGAEIIAVEPEASNYRLLCTNATGYANINPLQAGLWNRKTHLTIEDPRAATWAFRVAEDSSGKHIPAVRVGDLLNDFDLARIDILKMDIEGSEIEVFESCADWIDKVGAIIVELHDWFRPGCRAALETALGGHRYEAFQSGENTVIRNLKRNAA